MLRTIEFTIEHGDILSHDADVVAVKYAQAFYGVDQLVAQAISPSSLTGDQFQPKVGEHQFVTSLGRIRAKDVLFLGVPPLGELEYQHLRALSREVLEILAREAPEAKHLAMTIHDPGFGLDEVQALLAQFEGYLDAIRSGRLPAALDYISIVEISKGRLERLRNALDDYLDATDFASQVLTRWAYRLALEQQVDQSRRRRKEIVEEEARLMRKPRAFIAMPFSKEFEDIYYYGIQGALHAAGFLCERIDQQAFTGDILEQIKKKIEHADLVIAELSGANANVHLEIGYAWGKGRPTILLTKNSRELPFDVRGQRCLIYNNIQHLEQLLTSELSQLRARSLDSG